MGDSCFTICHPDFVSYVLFPHLQQAVIFDEVDGMAGNEDRGGLAEIIQMIKTTKMPIICIANDLNQKVRSLRNYCFELPFHKLQTKQIRGPMMSIAFKEGKRLL